MSQQVSRNNKLKKNARKSNHRRKNQATNYQTNDFRQQLIPLYIDDKKLLYDAILDIFDTSEDYLDQNKIQALKRIIDNKKPEENIEEMKEFLQIIKNIADNYHREGNFIQNVITILQYFDEKIKQTLTNDEIFDLFQDNKIVLLYLFKNKMITISDEIYLNILNKIDLNGTKYRHFFYPEIKEYIGDEKINDIKNELLAIDPNIFDNFEEKREKGENASYICSLIQEDKVEEFISYVNQTNISLNSQIPASLFETNSFLISKKQTLIEYAVFFGSIQIFQYLYRNNISLTHNLWIYAIHSRNAELIDYLDSNNLSPPNNKYEECFIESIKCHHNEIAYYIESNYLSQNENEKDVDVVLNIMRYRNYAFFPIDFETTDEFFYLGKFKYDKLVNLFIMKKEEEIKMKIIKQ